MMTPARREQPQRVIPGPAEAEACHEPLRCGSGRPSRRCCSRCARSAAASGRWPFHPHGWQVGVACSSPAGGDTGHPGGQRQDPLARARLEHRRHGGRCPRRGRRPRAAPSRPRRYQHGRPVALQYALDHPADISRLVVAGLFAGIPPEFAELRDAQTAYIQTHTLREIAEEPWPWPSPRKRTRRPGGGSSR